MEQKRTFRFGGDIEKDQVCFPSTSPAMGSADLYSLLSANRRKPGRAAVRPLGRPRGGALLADRSLCVQGSNTTALPDRRIRDVLEAQPSEWVRCPAGSKREVENHRTARSRAAGARKPTIFLRRQPAFFGLRVRLAGIAGMARFDSGRPTLIQRAFCASPIWGVCSWS